MNQCATLAVRSEIDRSNLMIRRDTPWFDLGHPPHDQWLRAIPLPRWCSKAVPPTRRRACRHEGRFLPSELHHPKLKGTTHCSTQGKLDGRFLTTYGNGEPWPRERRLGGKSLLWRAILLFWVASRAPCRCSFLQRSPANTRKQS